MSECHPDDSFPADFTGRVRLFPLPNFVMFPGVVQPLRVFEPRYCELLQEALDDDRLIAMTLLCPGWESDYDGRPPVEEVVCISRVIAHCPQDDGSHNILLRGLRRATILRELPANASFREAEIALLDDYYEPHGAGRRGELLQDLTCCFARYAKQKGMATTAIDDLMDGELPLGMLTDMVAFAASMDAQFNQFLLAEPSVDCRARLLLQHMLDEVDVERQHCDCRTMFPPEFSAN